MVSDTQIRCVALFFLFSFLDEKIALPSADKAIAVLKTRVGRLAEESTEAKQALVTVCYQQFQKSKKEMERGKVSPSLNTILRAPLHVDLKAWTQFQKESGEEELVTVIFNKILGISTSDIALALGISEGTAHYRLGHGIRKLGELERTLNPGAEA